MPSGISKVTSMPILMGNCRLLLPISTLTRSRSFHRLRRPNSFYKNDGNKQSPIWTKITSHSLSSQYHQGGSLIFADIDADNDQNLIIGQSDSRIYEYRNDGTAQTGLDSRERKSRQFYIGKIGRTVFPPALTWTVTLILIYFGEMDGNINVSENTGSASARSGLRIGTRSFP